MDNIAKLIVIIALGYLLVTCSDTQKAPQSKSANTSENNASLVKEKRLSARFDQIKQIGRTFNAEGQPAVFILLSSGDQDFLDIYLLRSVIKDDYLGQNHALSQSEVELRAQWKGTRFVQSSQYSTQVTLKIQKITPTEAMIDLSGALVNSATGIYLNVSASRITVSGENLKQLFGDI